MGSEVWTLQSRFLRRPYQHCPYCSTHDSSRIIIPRTRTEAMVVSWFLCAVASPTSKLIESLSWHYLPFSYTSYSSPPSQPSRILGFGVLVAAHPLHQLFFKFCILKHDNSCRQLKLPGGVIGQKWVLLLNFPISEKHNLFPARTTEIINPWGHLNTWNTFSVFKPCL